MKLHLDSRQRAMLEEMKVHVWWPGEAIKPAALPPQTATNTIVANAIPSSVTGLNRAHSSATHPRTRPAHTPIRPEPAKPPAHPLGSLPDNISTMQWPELTDAIHRCQACAMSAGRGRPVFTPAPALKPCDWLIAGDLPDDDQISAATPFAGAAGRLLTNMLAAVGAERMTVEKDDSQTPRQRAYLTLMLKCRPALPRVPELAELAQCEHYLRREIALVQPKVIVAMGRFARQVLLSESPPELTQLPLAQLRLQVWRYAGVPVVVTYPPDSLLRSGKDKAGAWADLCLAQDIVESQTS